MKIFISMRAVVLLAAVSACLIGPAARAQAGTITVVASTIPPKGDLNPYGTAMVTANMGSLVKGDILISNFNDKNNLQGTGNTIVEISPSGHFSVFAKVDDAHLPSPCPGGIGFTTALATTRSGWTFVGSLPTKDGTAATARAGCVLVINSVGQVVETFFGSLVNGPWDMASLDGGNRVTLWVTNVLNGTVAAGGQVVHGGTVVRMDLQIPNGGMPRLTAVTVVGSGFEERSDPVALVIGPTGLGFSRDANALYVADSLRDRVAAISDPLTRTKSAGQGTTVTSGGAIADPLGLAVGQNGDILTVNGTNGFLVRTTAGGAQVAKALLDSSGTPPGNGALFGLAVAPGTGLYYVDDATNTLNLFQP